MATEEHILRDLLRENDYTMLANDPDGEEWWEDPAGHVMTMDQACDLVFGTCSCCGKYNAYVSSACMDRHEAKDCLCYKQSSDTV